MTLLEAFELLPKSERTLMRHKYEFKGLSLHNDMGYSCEYRIIQNGIELGVIKYYGGRKLACYEVIRTEEVSK